MTNAVYQATVEALEALMSPRVVSRSLQEGLKQVGKSPTEIGYGDVEVILKSQVYRQLQVTMPVTEAKAKISTILEQIKLVRPSDRAPRAASADSVAELRESLRPFNLYFEWPEVQKFRAQLQLIEAEQTAGREVGRLIQEAQAQLAALERKLEDSLVVQARGLAELEEALAAVQSLGGPKVRRLENLVGHIGTAQRSRQLAPAEMERASKLATELRKLLESSVVLPDRATGTGSGAAATPIAPNPAAPPGTEGAAEALDPDLNAKLARLDRASERQALTRLGEQHASLLEHRPDLRDSFAVLSALLEAGQPAAEPIEDLRAHLTAEEATLRQTLRAELSGLIAELNALPQDVDTAEASYLAQVNASVLDAALPPLRDIRQLRDLAQLARAQGQEILRQQRAAGEEESRKLEQQAQATGRLEATLARYRTARGLAGEVAALEEALADLRAAHDLGTTDAEALAAARQAEVQLEAAAAAYAEAESERQRAQLHGLLSDLRSLPLGPQERGALDGRLETYLGMLGHEPLPADLVADAQAELQALKEDLRARYRAELAALQARAEALGVGPLLGRIHTDEEGLERDLYPDLSEIGRALARATEARRAERLHDLHRLESELGSYQGANAAQAEALQARLDAVRTELKEADDLPDLAPLWEALSALQSDLARRSADFFPRLDAALGVYARVSVINSDEVAAAGRILGHLDRQRAAFDRVSAGMQSELEASLQEAERLLADLEAQFEATQAVAGQLTGGGLLDGFFDLFGDAEPSPKPPADPDPLEAWAAKLRGLPGVREVWQGPESVGATQAQALQALHADAQALGDTLSAGASRWLVLEMAAGALVVATPGAAHPVAVRVADAAAAEAVCTYLQETLSEVQDCLD